MRKVGYTLGVLIGALGVAMLLGPRIAVETTIQPLVLPEDLDAYLAHTEARFTDLRPGAEKTIIWANTAAPRRTAHAIVYLHGFSATRQETRPLSDTLAARLGANLFYTRMTGHGRSEDALADARVNDWLHDGYESIEVGRRLGEKVILVGTSNGATLAAWLAAQPDVAEALSAVVLISPNFGPKDPSARILLWPWGRTMARLIVGPYYQWEPNNDEHAAYWTTRYPVEALGTMMGLVDLVDRTDLGAVQTPLLLLYSPQDEVIEAALIDERYPKFGAAYKRLVAFEAVGDPSNHVLAGAILSPAHTEPVADSILAFLKPLVE